MTLSRPTQSSSIFQELIPLHMHHLLKGFLLTEKKKRVGVEKDECNQFLKWEIDSVKWCEMSTFKFQNSEIQHIK